MRKFEMSGRRVICRNSSLIGYSTNVARPGSWIVFSYGATAQTLGRVLGRIEKTDQQGANCKGWLAVVRLGSNGMGAHVIWVDPTDVRECYGNPPAALLAWMTGADWPADAAGRARVVAMSEHGTLSEKFIGTRDDPAKPYNSRPEYAAQWTLE